MRKRLSAIGLLAALVLCGQSAAATGYTSISPAEFESLLKKHNAKVWRSGKDSRDVAQVRIMDAESFDVRYWGCENARAPAWVCAYSIDRTYRKLRLTPEQVNKINGKLALGRVYALASDDGRRKRGDVVLDYTVSLGRGLTAEYMVGSFGEMIEGIEDHFEAALTEEGIAIPDE